MIVILFITTVENFKKIIPKWYELNYEINSLRKIWERLSRFGETQQKPNIYLTGALSSNKDETIT